jgi:hypothetical protein
LHCPDDPMLKYALKNAIINRNAIDMGKAPDTSNSIAMLGRFNEKKDALEEKIYQIDADG